MTRNPFINAIAAALYIAGVVSLLYFGIPLIATPGQQPPFLFFVSILSLFVLSVLAMCISFLLQPFILAFESKSREGAKLLLQTGGIFAIIAAALFTALFVIFG